MRKKLILLIIIILTGYNWLSAQTPTVDSIRALLNAHLQNDTTKVNLLNDLAREIRRVDRKQMQPLTEQALSLTRQLKYRKGEGYALLNMALIFFDKYVYQEALTTFQKAL